MVKKHVAFPYYHMVDLCLILAEYLHESSIGTSGPRNVQLIKATQFHYVVVSRNELKERPTMYSFRRQRELFGISHPAPE